MPGSLEGSRPNISKTSNFETCRIQSLEDSTLSRMHPDTMGSGGGGIGTDFGKIRKSRFHDRRAHCGVETQYFKDVKF